MFNVVNVEIRLKNNSNYGENQIIFPVLKFISKFTLLKRTRVGSCILLYMCLKLSKSIRYSKTNMQPPKGFNNKVGKGQPKTINWPPWSEPDAAMYNYWAGINKASVKNGNKSIWKTQSQEKSQKWMLKLLKYSISKGANHQFSSC